jgi:hypothetical protein
VSFNPPSLRPGIGGVVMIDISDQDSGRRLMQDEREIAPHPRGPKIRVLGLVDPVHLEPRRRWIELKV